MLRILLIAAAIILAGFFLKRFVKGYRQWKTDRHFLDKVLIGLNQTLREVAVIQAVKGEHEDIKKIQGKITQFKNDIEHRRTRAPIKFDGFAATAAELDGIGTRLSLTAERLSMFGEEGVWGCSFASTALETMAEYHMQR
jgi:hypothetical protein